MTPRITLFVTGITGQLGRAVLERLLADRRVRRIFALVRDDRSMPAASSVIVPLAGDVTVRGLGISAASRAGLAAEVTHALHMAADTVFSRPLAESRRTNLVGTRHLLDLAADWKCVERFTHMSTAFVAGRLTGRVPEAANDHTAGWVNGYEQSKAEAERSVRELRNDWVIVRPSTLVCDDESGVVSHQNAIHRALRLMHAGLTSMMPSALGSALDVVTTRYVARATAMMALDAGTTRATYHLCAGDHALPLDELVDLTFAVWMRDATWRAKGISRPVLTDLDTYTLFARSVEETGDARLRQTVRSLSHFVPQLALAKRFDTTLADRVVGARAPEVRRFWACMVDSLRARAVPRAEAAA